MLNRIAKIRKSIQKAGIDSFFITNQFNISYLTAFSGLAQNEREAFFFITPKNACLLTFPTYYGLFEKGGDGFKTLCITHEKRLTDHLKEIIRQEQVKSVGFEEENLTIAELVSLKKRISCHSDPDVTSGEESPIRMTTHVHWQKTKGIVENLRIIKDETELSHIRKAASITDQAFEYIKTKIKKGVSEKLLALELEIFLKKNSDGVAFSPIVAFNKNAAIPHYLPTKNYELRTKNLILLDFGARVNGYCADMTRVVFYGKPTNEQVKVYNTVLVSQELALNKIKPGLKCFEVDKIARDYIVSQGYPEYPHGLGHGVGLDIHEEPRLKKGKRTILQKNMVVTVEPGVYLPGEYGIRIEDLTLIKPNGVEILTQSPKDLVIL